MKREHDVDEHPRTMPHSSANKVTARVSTWVVVGFLFWIGFFIGAVILHAMVK